MSPQLTIGMAHFDDFDGAYFTLQALKLYHDLSEVELIVVDNNPTSKHGKELKSFVENKCSNSRYIPFENTVGTTQSRELIFQEAKGRAVLCMDCHVLLAPGSVARLIQFYKNNPDSPHLYQGPLVHDHLKGVQTHFDLIWRSEMWGVWGQAWKRKNEIGHWDYFSIRNEEGKAIFQDLVSGEETFASIIDMPYNEQEFAKLGFVKVGTHLEDEPFEIPAQGLGVFTCLKKSWLGFNPDFRGFGGEEGYIHEKYRQAGHKTICLPFLQWVHRFGRVNGVPYPLTKFNKVRNYVIGFDELGLPLDPIYKHFIESGRWQEQAWQEILKNVFEPTPPQKIEDVYKRYRDHQTRDLDQHFDTLREHASRCEKVVEITKRKESSIPFLAAKPKQLLTYQEEFDQVFSNSLVRVNEKTVWANVPTRLDDLPVVEECDLLFIDSRHTGKRAMQELDAYAPKVSRYIIFHDTKLYGIKGEDGQAGLAVGITEWLRDNPNWFICYHTNNQYGLTILSQYPEDKPSRTIHLLPPGKGPGTELKKLLKKIGIEAKPNCSCNARANRMDIEGIDWCKENTETIVDWLEEESKKRNLPFVRMAGRTLVKRAIKNAESQQH